MLEHPLRLVAKGLPVPVHLVLDVGEVAALDLENNKKVWEIKLN